jgi:hypothetical protein
MLIIIDKYSTFQNTPQAFGICPDEQELAKPTTTKYT